MSIDVFTRRMTDVVTMFIVTAVSLLLLVYVGFAEGRRVYEQFHLETLTSEGRTLQNIIENYLRIGLPLNQYAGFSNVANPIAQFKEIDAIVIYDVAGHEIFKAVDKSNPKLPETSAKISPRPSIGTPLSSLRMANAKSPSTFRIRPRATRLWFMDTALTAGLAPPPSRLPPACPSASSPRCRLK